MTVSVNGRPDVLSTAEAWALCRAHSQLALKTDQVGNHIAESGSGP